MRNHVYKYGWRLVIALGTAGVLASCNDTGESNKDINPPANNLPSSPTTPRPSGMAPSNPAPATK